MTNLHVLPEGKVRHEIKVDLDERAFLFPAGKPVIQLVFIAEGRRIHLEAVFPFNMTHTPPRIFSLGLDDARDFAYRAIEVVHTAKTQLVVSESMHISINVVANGYRFQFGDMTKPIEMFLGTNAIWRVCHALLRAIDSIGPVESN